jgi:hypothetical protein
MPLFVIYCAYFIQAIQAGTWKKVLVNKWSSILIVLFLSNVILKYPELLPSPAEIHVQKIELCNRLGFSKTALALLAQPWYSYTGLQQERLKRAEAMARNNKLK